MIPSESDLYSYELKTGNAAVGRAKFSVSSPTQQLKVAYRKYKGKTTTENTLKVNILFIHGTGMNKGLWHYHIDKLFNNLSTHKGVELSTVLAMDIVNHGDSAVLNEGKLGYVFDWRDNARDILQLVSNEERKDFVETDNKINILIGHSLGGFVSMYTCYLGPTLFDACVTINPVAYMNDDIGPFFSHITSSWYKRGYMKDEFPTGNATNWYDVLEDHFTKSSFFVNSDRTVLKNLLEDEVSDADKKALKDRLVLKSTVKNQMFTYNGSLFAIAPTMPLFSHITTPTYWILSEKDTAPPDAREFLADALKNVLTKIDIPGGKHIVNAEQPDLVVQIITAILEKHISLATSSTGESSANAHFQKAIDDQFASIINPSNNPHL